jgi:hypothetical protein
VSKSLLSCALLAFLSPAAFAQVAGPAAQPALTAKVAGSLRVMAEACGHQTPAQAEAARASARAALAQQGLAAATFDQYYVAGQAETTRQWNALAPNARAQMCATLTQLLPGHQAGGQAQPAAPRVAPQAVPAPVTPTTPAPVARPPGV